MLKVLIADDEEKICQLIEKLINWKSLGLKVAAVASNGVDAVKKIMEYRPDIVITDIRMPGIDGMELNELKKYVQIQKLLLSAVIGTLNMRRQLFATEFEITC